MSFKYTWDSRNPRTSSPGRLYIQPADHTAFTHRFLYRPYIQHSLTGFFMPYTISTFFNQGPCKSHSLHCCQGMDFFDARFPCKQCSGGCSCQRKSLNLHLPNQRGPSGRVCSLQQDICAQYKCAQVQLLPSALFCWQLGEGKKKLKKKLKLPPLVTTV